MIASANMDSNEGGGNEGVRILLNPPLEEVNSAFAAIPMVHGSPTTVATKFDEMAERGKSVEDCLVESGAIKVVLDSVSSQFASESAFGVFEALGTLG